MSHTGWQAGCHILFLGLSPFSDNALWNGFTGGHFFWLIANFGAVIEPPAEIVAFHDSFVSSVHKRGPLGELCSVGQTKLNADVLKYEHGAGVGGFPISSERCSLSEHACGCLDFIQGWFRAGWHVWCISPQLAFVIKSLGSSNKCWMFLFFYLHVAFDLTCWFNNLLILYVLAFLLEPRSVHQICVCVCTVRTVCSTYKTAKSTDFLHCFVMQLIVMISTLSIYLIEYRWTDFLVLFFFFALVLISFSFFLTQTFWFSSKEI